MKTLFISLSFVAVTATGVGIMIWQAEPINKDQTPDIVARHQSIIDEQLYAIDDRTTQRNKGSSQRVDERLRRLESKLQKLAAERRLKPLSEDLTEAEREALAMEEKHREQEQDQHYIERLSAYYAELENQHLQQTVDSEWAGTKEEQIISSFETQSTLDNFDLVDIDCRTNSCALDFEILASNNESDSSSSTFFDWVLENTGNCEIHSEAAVASTNPEGNATQRIHLTNCV